MGTRGGIARNADANADAVGESRACELRHTKHVLQATRVIAVTVFSTKQGYPKPLRRIHSKDPKTGRKRVVITNHPNDLALVPLRWIRQHLCKPFFGTSEKPVMSQIWIARSVAYAWG